MTWKVDWQAAARAFSGARLSSGLCMAVLALGLTGCPAEKPAACNTTAECSAGETCHQGICLPAYGRDGGPGVDAGRVPDAGQADGGMADAGACATSVNDDVRLRLASRCIACHGEGTNLPMFASLAAFENVLVYNPDFVTPGDPAGSRLMQLLRGEATGSFTQMPLGTDTFAALDAAGETDISMAELFAWITDLPPRAGGAGAIQDRATVRRVTAAEMVRTAHLHLGLDEDADFHGNTGTHHQSPTLVLKGTLPVRSPDRAPRLHYRHQRPAYTRYRALGGASHLERAPASNAVTPSMLQTWTQVSQGWCKMAVDKAENPALFQGVSRDDDSASQAPAIRANLARLHLRFLGEPATSDDVDKLFTLFTELEPEGTRIAWQGVCAALLRHPLWLAF